MKPTKHQKQLLEKKAYLYSVIIGSIGTLLLAVIIVYLMSIFIK